MPLFCSYLILTSSVIYYWTDARQHGIYLLILPQLPVISQSDWLICRCRWESRQRCTRHARVILSRSVIANQERSFWEINQSYCGEVVDNACSFFESWFWSRSKIKTFFGIEYCGKKQMESGSALSVLLSTTIFVITVVKICCGLTRRTLWPLWWRIPLSIRVQTTLNHFRFVKFPPFFFSSTLFLVPGFQCFAPTYYPITCTLGTPPATRIPWLPPHSPPCCHSPNVPFLKRAFPLSFSSSAFSGSM